MVGVELTSNIALDFLQGLYDVYIDFKNKNLTEAINNLETLAILLIASTMDASEEVIAELLSKEYDSYDFDSALTKLMTEENNDKA